MSKEIDLDILRQDISAWNESRRISGEELSDAEAVVLEEMLKGLDL